LTDAMVLRQGELEALERREQAALTAPSVVALVVSCGVGAGISYTGWCMGGGWCMDGAWMVPWGGSWG
jgi:hypothetical protein